MLSRVMILNIVILYVINIGTAAAPCCHTHWWKSQSFCRVVKLDDV